jgi:hypothetical protein
MDKDFLHPLSRGVPSGLVSPFSSCLLSFCFAGNVESWSLQGISPLAPSIPPLLEGVTVQPELKRKRSNGETLGAEREMCPWAISISILVIRCPTRLIKFLCAKYVRSAKQRQRYVSRIGELFYVLTWLSKC